MKQGLLSIVEQGLKFLKGLTDKEVVKRIAKITRVDVTDPRTVNYAKFYKIAIEAAKSHEVLRQLNKEVAGIIPVGNEFSNRSIQEEIQQLLAPRAVALEHSEPSINAAKEVLITSRPLITFANATGITQKTTAKTTVEDPIDELARRLENVFI